MATSPAPLPNERNPRPDRGFTELYENIALYPDLGRFRRFGALWAKLVHDDTEEVLTNQNLVHKALKRIRTTTNGTTVLDCPRWFVKVEHPDIYKSIWKPYEESLRRYGETLCLSQQIMKLPDQAGIATKYLATFKQPTFDPNSSGKFGLTQESAAVYLGPPERHDTCAWRGLSQEDFLTKLFLRIGSLIEDHILKRIRDSSARKGHVKQWDGPDIRHHVVVEIADYLTCISASILLTGTMFTLAHIRLLDTRIGGVGALGTVFALLVKLMAGSSSRRVEVFAATAAFFAVASVFVSNTGSEGGGN